MSLKIISEKENPLFSRREIIAEITKEASPKNTDIQILLGEKFSASPETIKVDKIASKFGSSIFIISAKIYKSKEDKDNIEPKVKAAKAPK
ncbi:hypothetical protein A3K62_00730 [Candidatus Pacearchaeota archaeon RBG_16_35_8]|nr:MAG: hypothetical protein A3K62_00730 [Candidatus Pacearchaeota archaeon RBG_16_35_8]